MARVNLGTDKRNDEIIGTIAKYKTLRRISTDELIAKSGLKRATYYNRISKPQTFTLFELRAVLDALNVPQDERKGAI